MLPKWLEGSRNFRFNYFTADITLHLGDDEKLSKTNVSDTEIGTFLDEK